MSKLTEYLSLLPKGLPNADKVLESLWNNIQLSFDTLPEDEKEEILRRRLICQSCPLNNINAKTSEEYKALYGKNYTKKRQDLHCSICSCPIDSKTASLNSDCGLENYNAKHPYNKQELKWKAYIKK